MSQSYVKSCVFCKENIKMSDQNGKWLPYNQDGSQHDCKKEKKQITLEAVQKKLESLGIIINVERLMSQ